MTHRRRAGRDAAGADAGFAACELSNKALDNRCARCGFAVRILDLHPG